MKLAIFLNLAFAALNILVALLIQPPNQINLVVALLNVCSAATFLSVNKEKP